MRRAAVAALLALAAPAAPALAASDAALAAHDYTLHCSGCHRADGSGTPGTVPTLIGIGRFARTAEGRAYLVGVPGVAQAPVSDERLAALLNWIVGGLSKSTPDAVMQSVPFTTDEVTRLRAHPLRDPSPERARALAAEGKTTP